MFLRESGSACYPPLHNVIFSLEGKNQGRETYLVLS